MNSLDSGKLCGVRYLFVNGNYVGTHHLLGNHNHSLDSEASVAEVEEILKRWTKEVDDQDIVKTLLAEVVDIWNASCDVLDVYGAAGV